MTTTSSWSPRTRRRRRSTGCTASSRKNASVDDDGKWAVGFKLSDGMEIPEELAPRFKFARQNSKLAGTIRGSFFVIKGEY